MPCGLAPSRHSRDCASRWRLRQPAKQLETPEQVLFINSVLNSLRLLLVPSFFVIFFFHFPLLLSPQVYTVSPRLLRNDRQPNYCSFYFAYAVKKGLARSFGFGDYRSWSACFCFGQPSPAANYSLHHAVSPSKQVRGSEGTNKEAEKVRARERMQECSLAHECRSQLAYSSCSLCCLHREHTKYQGIYLPLLWEDAEHRTFPWETGTKVVQGMSPRTAPLVLSLAQTKAVQFSFSALVSFRVRCNKNRNREGAHAELKKCEVALWAKSFSRSAEVGFSERMRAPHYLSASGDAGGHPAYTFSLRAREPRRSA